MPSIGIADKTTLDAIKSTIDTNLDGKVSEVTPAFSSVVFGHFYGSINQASGYKLVESLTGRGLLKQINFMCGGLTENAFIKITRDEIVILDSGIHSSAADAARKVTGYDSSSASVHLLLDLYFNTSIKVEVKNNSASAYNCAAMTTCYLD